MNITVKEDRTVEKKYEANEGSQNENRITELTFTLPEAYASFVHKIVFITEDGNYTDYIEDGTYILKNNVTKYRKVKSYVWLTETSTNKDFRSELFELEFNYNEDPSDYIPTEEEKSQIELLMEELDEKIEEVTALEENVYTKTETNALLDGKISTSQKGANNGVAELDSNGKVPSSQLPSYVDDIIEGYYYNSKFYSDSSHTTEITPENGKIYVDLSSNKTYRWSGTAYVEISESLALGETSSTAYRGDRGKIAYDHATDSNRVQTAQAKKFYKVGVTAEGHISEVEEVAKSDLTALGVEDTSNKVTELDASDTHYPSSNAVKKVVDALDDNIDENTKDIEELGNILYGEEELESTDSEISFTGDENLELSITEIDGKTEQDSTKGYQLWGGFTYVNTSNSVTYINYSNSKISLSGTATGTSYSISSSNVLSNNYYKTLQAGTYSISGGYDNNIKLQAIAIDDSSSVTALATDSGTGATFTLTEATKVYLRIQTLTGIDTTGIIISPMLESGTTAHEWEKYTGGIASPNPSYKEDVQVVTGEQEVVVRGKNLAGNLQNIDINAQSGVESTNTNVVCTDYMPYDKTKTYWQSINGSNLANDTNLRFYNKNKEYIGYGLFGHTSSSGYGNFTITIGSSVTTTDLEPKYFRVRSNATTIPLNSKYMIANDSNLTYEPYYKITKQLSLGDIELAKIGTYRDYLWKNLTNGKWYKHSVIGKRIFDGTESWQIGQSGTANWYYSISENIGGMTGSAVSQLKCNYYPYSSITSTTTGEGIWYSSSSVRIRYGTQDTPANFKTWLSTHNVLLYFILETETDTEITDTTLISQLEAIQKLQQITGTNIVEIVSTEGNLSADFKIVYETDSIDYLKDTKENKSNKTTVVSSTSTDEEYPSGKAVYTYVNGVVGDINTLLDNINREVV